MPWARSASSSSRPKLPRKNSRSIGASLRLSHAWLTGFARQALAGTGLRLMRVVGCSMLPALRPGELVLVDASAFRRRPPRRGEVVVARPDACGGRALVKRILAVPHDPIELDGQRWRLGRDEFFIAGDRQEDSLDSRRFGPVVRADILGLVRAWRPAWRAAAR